MISLERLELARQILTARRYASAVYAVVENRQRRVCVKLLASQRTVYAQNVGTAEHGRHFVHGSSGWPLFTDRRP